MTERTPSSGSPSPGFVREGVREFGRKIRRGSIRRAIATDRRRQTEQLTRIGEKVWSARLELPGTEGLRTRLMEVEDKQSGVASRQVSIDEAKRRLETERAGERERLNQKRQELTQERRVKLEQSRAAKKAVAKDPSAPVESQLALLESGIRELDGKLADLARERRETLAPLDKRLSETRKEGERERREGAALVREKQELFFELGSTVVDGGVTDPSIVDELTRLAGIEGQRTGLEEELATLQAASEGMAPGVMAKFYGVIGAVLILPVFLGAVGWFAWSHYGSSGASRSARDRAPSAERRRPQVDRARVGTEKVDAIVQSLRRGDADERVNASRALGEAGAEAVPALLELLVDRNQENRADAAYAFAEMSELPERQAPVAVARLVEALKDESWRVRANAAVALGFLGTGSSDAWRGLAEAVEDSDARVRGAAAYSLGKIEVRPSDTVVILSKLLIEDPVPDVRVLAAGGLAPVGRTSAVPALVAALSDQNWQVQYNSMGALATLGEHSIEALPALIDLLPRLRPSLAPIAGSAVQRIVEAAGPGYRPSRKLSQALERRIELIARFSTVGDSRRGMPIAAALPTLVEWMPSATTQLTVELAPLLWESGGESAEFMAELVLPALLSIAKVRRESAAALVDKLEDSDRNVRWAAASALGAMHAEQGAAALIRVLADEDPGVRRAAAQALAHLGPGAITPLSEALGHRDPGARVHAAYALAEIGRDADDEAVVSALNSALQDDEFIVREAVACALKNIQRIIDCDPNSLSGLTGR